MTEKKLLPCPFCGILDSDYGQPYQESDDEFTKYVMCGNCEIKGQSSEYWDTAIEFWNTRACNKQSIDYMQGFMDAKKQILQAVDRLFYEDDNETILEITK